MSPIAESVRRFYITLALVILNLGVGVLAINVLSYLGLAALDAWWPRENVVQEKYGYDLAELYPDVSRRDINELLNETWNRKKLFAPYTMFREAPYTGRYVNVHEAGFRVSKDQGPWPLSETNYNVFLFGGSTTFSYGLPDDESLASHLQAALVEKQGRPVKVYNFGVGAFQSTQEKILFQELINSGHRPDLAIFVDGLNEFAFPDEPMGSRELRRLLEDTPARRFIWLSSAIVERTPMVQLIKDVAARSHIRIGNNLAAVSADLKDPAARRSVEKSINRYISNQRQIDAIAAKEGVTVVFVWQPVPYYKYDMKLHPFQSDANRFVGIGYQQFHYMRHTVAGPRFLWCADMQEHSQERLYVDSAHYTARMSEQFAGEIAERIRDAGIGDGSAEVVPTE